MPKRMDDMTPAEVSDFIEELHAAVYEQLQPHEIAQGAIDMVGDERVVHGPWRPEDCSRVLVRWQRAGLLTLYRYNADGSAGDELSPDEVVAVLGDPGSWIDPDGWSGRCALVATDRGDSTPLRQWQELLVPAGRPPEAPSSYVPPTEPKCR